VIVSCNLADFDGEDDGEDNQGHDQAQRDRLVRSMLDGKHVIQHDEQRSADYGTNDRLDQVRAFKVPQR
jgi:hypothetical protein